MTHPSKPERPSGKGRFLYSDTEAIGLLHSLRHNDSTSMHVIGIQDLKTGEYFQFFDPYEYRDPEAREKLDAEGEQDGYLIDGVKMLLEAEAIAMHNYTGYDALALETVFPEDWRINNMEKRGKDRAWGTFFPYRVMDTYVLSTLLNPDRKAPQQAYALGKGNVGPHSIEAHGIRINHWKPENEDWTKLTDHMLTRVKDDCYIGADLFWYLMKEEWHDHLHRGPNRSTGYGIETAYGMELQCALSMARQARRGFRLDMQKALNRWEELHREIQDTEDAFRPHMPPRLKMKSAKPADIAKWEKDAVKLFDWLPHEDASEMQDWLATFMQFDSDMPFGESYEWSTTVDDITHISYAATMWNPTNKGGNYSKNAQKYVKEARGNINDYEPWNRPIAGPFTPIVYEEIPLGNRDAVKQVLYSQGWRGVNYNDTEQEYLDDYGVIPYPWSGKIDEESIERWKEQGEVPEWAEGIARWYILSARANQILNAKDIAYFKQHEEWPKQPGGKRQCRGLIARAWSEEYRIEAQDFYAKMRTWPTEDEWRIPAVAIPIGTNTFRMRHRNVVNIPSRGLYPLRDLFIASDGYMVLGCDGAGLELRMLAHFMNDEDYIDQVLNGDIHTYNQEMAGLPTRDMAKTFIYAFLYGSGLPNLAAVTGLSIKDMEKRVEEFKAKLPALSNLIEALERVGKKFGHVLAVDGRWGRIRAKSGELLVHTILNVLLQMTGSLCMKWGLVFAEDAMREEGVALDHRGWPLFIANVHDEIQMEVLEDEVEYTSYEINSEDWKAEEKRTHKDEGGRVWSAPSVLDGDVKSDDTVLIERRYHRAGELLAEKMTTAGEYLGIRIPLAGEYKIGHSWAETH